ncbi:MAG: hypothetical protein K1X57_12175 [Gemmataceae bacterium]|nr:hypothetical protein [Gemmataceae bacterium]
MPKRPISDDDREELIAYLDGESDRAARKRVEARLNSDPRLRAEADALKKAWELLDHLPRPEPNPTFTTKTLDKLAALRPVSPSATIVLPQVSHRVPWVWAAITAGGLALGWFAVGLLTGGRSSANVRLDDPVLVRDLRLIENLPLFHAAESIEFLHALDTPDRFGADSPGP